MHHEFSCFPFFLFLFSRGKHKDHVTATDACPEAVVYAAHNLALNGLEGDVAAADWRDLPEMEGAPWDLVIGADLLYRPDNHQSLQRLLPALTTGEAWIADPGRGGCRDFLAAARACWRIESESDPADADLRVHRLSPRAVRS